MRFEVVATKWSNELKRKVEEVIGRFDKFYHAKLFCDAYNEYFKSNARIVEYREVK